MWVWLNFSIIFRYLNRNPRIPAIYQIYTAAVSLIATGGGETTTEHLSARINSAREATDKKKILWNVITIPR
jgi:hypothetical protein